MKIIIASPAHKKRVLDFIDKLPYEPQWVIDCKLQKSKKTYAQLSTAHMWFKEVRDAFQESGKMYTFNAVKYYFKDMFGLVVTHDTPTGEKAEQKSLADYTVEEMSAFMDKCYHHAVTDLHFFVTLPGYDDE